MILKTILTAITIALTINASAQDTANLLTFKEVEWTIKLPPSFKVLSAEQDKAVNERGKQAIQSTIDLEVDNSQTKTLISAAKNQFSYFNATITPFNPAKDGNWNEVNQGVKDILYTTFKEKITDGKVDTATTRATISGVTFDKYEVVVSMGDKILFHSCLLSKLYKGFDFGISYLFADNETKEEIETMLKNSAFNNAFKPSVNNKSHSKRN
jgi:hypothetical protein